MIEIIVVFCSLAGCGTVQASTPAESLDDCHRLFVMARERAAEGMKVSEADLTVKEFSCVRQPEDGASPKGG